MASKKNRPRSLVNRLRGKRKSPKKFTTKITVTVVVEAHMELMRNEVRRQIKKAGWELIGELDGPSLRIKCAVPIVL